MKFGMFYEIQVPRPATPEAEHQRIREIIAKSFWSGRAGSNCRPPGPKPGALPLGHAPKNA